MEKLQTFGVPADLCLWLLSFLTERPQYVKTQQETSSILTLNTGAPQGCVLSPVLFILYTSDLQWSSDTDSVSILKYADDTAIIGLIKDDECDEYMKCIDFVKHWCDSCFLELNVNKTKEVIFDFRRSKFSYGSVKIDSKSVEIVPVYKYLGLSVDHNVTFKDHVELKLKQSNKRLYCIRQMKKNKVKKKLIEMFYNAMIPSVLLYACSGFFNLLTKSLKHDLDRPRRICTKLIGDGENLVKQDVMYKNATLSLAAKIIKDHDHPLCSQYVLLRSGRRYRLPRIRTSRFRSTFVPSSLIIMNE